MKPGHRRIHPENSEKTAMASFWQQLKILLWRNILLKKRNKSQLFQELFFPVYFVAILAMVRALTKPETKPGLTFPTYGINSTDFSQPYTADSRIFVSPNTSQIDSWMQTIVSQLNGPPQYKLFASEQDAEDEFQSDQSHVTAGIIFNYGGNPYAYAIRTSYDKTPKMDSVFNFNGGQCRSTGKGTDDYRSCTPNGYITSGFVQLQAAVENILLTEAGVTTPDPFSRNISVQMMDIGEFEPDTSGIQTMSSIYFVFSLMILASYLAGNVVAEKERKIKEGMMMMGLSNGPFWLSWVIIYAGMAIFASVVMSAIIAATEFVKQSNVFLLLIIFLLYGASLIAFSLMMSTFFSKARTAGGVTGLGTVIFSCLYLAVSQTRDEGSYDSNVPAWSQWIMCLLSPVAFATCIDQGLFLDIRENGFGFDDSLSYGKFPLYAPMLMMAVDTVIYTLLLLYFDKVIPGEYGLRYPPLFFLMPSYWCPARRMNEELRSLNVGRENGAVDIEMVPQSMDQNIAMKISSLSKSFKVKNEFKDAVSKFSLDIYQGHITCLLGHNGAGKTTLMNMLTGVIPPTSGTATVMGWKVTDPGEMKHIRQMCGICPQHNILYDLLSCREHLKLFAEIKGVQPEDIEKLVEQSLEDVDLVDQGDTFAKDLSGGQKRKLSVAIALIGDPKLIFLDEPTAGMDPYSRRHLWSLLKNKKKGRVVLLTTHFMDEADILSDRKAFMKNGQLRCCGSSLFLKNKFGIGYHLTMVVEPTSQINDITSALTSVIPGIAFERSHGKELSYTVPLSDVSMFADLFGQIDSCSSRLGIRSYGVSMTTLEEVFLKLEGQDEHSKSLENDNSAFVANEEDVNLQMETTEKRHFDRDITDESVLRRQCFRAVLWIRFLSVIRNGRAVFAQIVLPVIFIIIALVVLKVVNRDNKPSLPEPLDLQPSLYVSTSENRNLSNLLVFDSVGTPDSQSVINYWKSTMEVDAYATNSTNFTAVEPHSMGVQIDELAGQTLNDFVALYNATANHAIPIAVTLASQSMLNSSGINVALNSTTYPWPNVKSEPKYDSSALFAGILVGMAFLSIIPGFATEVVRDRELKLRSQLRITGVSFGLYWGSIYLVNLLLYLAPCTLMIIVIFALGIEGLDSAGAIGALLVLFLTNIPFNCVFALVTSFMFNKAESCSNYLPYIFNMVAIIPYAVITSVDMVTTGDVGVILHYIFCIIDPPYLLLGGFYFIFRINLRVLIYGGQINDSDYFDPSNHTLIAMIMPLVHMLWMYYLLRVLDVLSTGGKVIEAFPFLGKRIKPLYKINKEVPANEDSDVLAERVRIDALPSHTQKEPVAYSHNVRKEFVKRVEKKSCRKPGKVKTKVAVRNLSFGVGEGEVFGLLGPNGAGKSTALNMMTAETEPTSGEVIIGGRNVRSNILSLSNSFGYCPQHDALWDFITLEEHIRCFAAIKGISPRNMDSLVDYYVSSLKVEEHRHKRAKKLSGGTKRKLSYVLSTLGNPGLVLLDEPSTGMDPQSKRFLWDTISSSFQGTDRGAILTTHYMEEADALCGRIGIMVNGQLECLGSGQQLKNKFGSGYILEVKLSEIHQANVEELMDALESHLKSLFPGLTTVERFMERAQYSIAKTDVTSLGSTFAKLEACKVSHKLEEYSFSQSTLEQVFLYFAKRQLDEGVHEGEVMEAKSSPRRSMSNPSHSIDL